MENSQPKRGRPPGKKAKTTPQRKKYEPTVKEEAKDLYKKGVSLERIAKYLNVPERTLTNWQTNENWRDGKEPHKTAIDLLAKGYSKAQIAERLEVSPKTVNRWIKPPGKEAAKTGR